MSDLGAIFGAIIATSNALNAGGMQGVDRAENYRKWQERAACAEYAIENGERDWQGAAWQCGAFGDDGVSRASDLRSIIIMLENAGR